MAALGTWDTPGLCPQQLPSQESAWPHGVPLVPISWSSPRPNQPHVLWNLTLPSAPTPPLRPWPTAPSSVASMPSLPPSTCPVLPGPLITLYLHGSYCDPSHNNSFHVLHVPSWTHTAFRIKPFNLQGPEAQMTWTPHPWLLPAFLPSPHKALWAVLLSENLPQGLGTCSSPACNVSPHCGG